MDSLRPSRKVFPWGRVAGDRHCSVVRSYGRVCVLAGRKFPVWTYPEEKHMGHLHVSGRLLEILNARQGRTFTIGQLQEASGLTHDQVISAMRTLVRNSNDRIVVVTRAKAWKMIKDESPEKTAPAAAKAAPATKPAKQAEKAAETPSEPAPAQEEDLLVLKMLGHLADGSEIGRDGTGQLWGVRQL